MKIFDGHVHVDAQTPIEDIIEPMDTLGIQGSALLAIDHGHQGEKRGSNVSNEFVYNYCQQAPDRLIGLGSIHPDHGSHAVNVVEDIMLKYRLRGIKIYPHSGFFPDHPVMMDVYHRLEELSGVLLIHTGVKAHRYQRMIYNRPLSIDEIAVACPNLPIVICHAGYPWVEEAFLVSRFNENVYIDITFLDTLEIVMGKDLVWDVVKQAKTIIGCNRIVWGSEGLRLGLEMYPDDGLERMRNSIRKVLDAPFLTSSEKEVILFGNSSRLFLE
jgi:predicted TIM-barrel fold metal-dependent hydrolase